jgi:hypothetical protein
MPKTTTIDHTSVLEMALVGYELQRNRIEAAIAEIQAQLGDGGSGRSSSTATTIAEPKTTGKRRFSAAARKRMAAAQKKRWAELKAKKAKPAKAKRTATPKRRKAIAPASRKQRPVQAKVAKKVAPKPKATVKKAPKPNHENASVEPLKIAIETPATNVEAVVESPLVVVTE